MKYCYATKRKSNELKLGTMISSLLFVFLSISLTQNVGYANTVDTITGAIADGKTITIKGSGFGSSGPNVVVFDDFESGTSGSNIKTGPGSAKYGKWNSKGVSAFYGTTAKVSGTKSFTSDFGASWSNGVEALLPANTRSVFVSWWIYVPTGNNWPGEGTNDGPNWKQMWILGNDSANDDYYFPVKMATNWLIAGNDPVSREYQVKTYVNPKMVKGEWKRMWG